VRVTEDGVFFWGGAIREDLLGGGEGENLRNRTCGSWPGTPPNKLGNKHQKLQTRRSYGGALGWGGPGVWRSIIRGRRKKDKGLARRS